MPLKSLLEIKRKTGMDWLSAETAEISAPRILDKLLIELETAPLRDQFRLMAPRLRLRGIICRALEEASKRPPMD